MWSLSKTIILNREHGGLKVQKLLLLLLLGFEGHFLKKKPTECCR
jgi:hypothetical protein